MLTRIAARRGAVVLAVARPFPRAAVVYPASARAISWTPWRAPPAPQPPATAHIPDPFIVPDSHAHHAQAVHEHAPATASSSTPVDFTAPPAVDGPASLLPQGPADGAASTLAEMLSSGKTVDEVLSSPEAVHAAMRVADLHDIGLDHRWFSLPGWTADGLVAMHNATGLPWWASIAAMTIGMRMCLFPLIVRNLKHNSRLAAVGPQMQALMKRAGEAKKANDQNALVVTSQHLQQLMKTHDVSPIRPLILPLFQFPFFLGMFYALQRLAYLPLPQLKEGGFGWVTDLTAADPYMILPILSIGLQLLVMQVGVDGTSASSNASSARTMAHFKNFLLISSPLTVWFLSGFPSAVLFYWTFSNSFTLAQALMLRSPTVRKLLNVPPPAVVPAVPGAAAVNTKPSLLETLRAPTDWYNSARDQALQQRAQHAADHAASERTKGQRAGMALLTERVNEAPVESARPAATAGSGFLENAEATQREAPGYVSKEEAKRRRVEAARERRQQRQ